MSTLQELIRYCEEEHHIGALLLVGEWGCGKTYLVEKELAKALSSTHYIVRVSLLGIDSVEALKDALRKQWLATCTPFLGKLKQEREKIKSGNQFLLAIGNILKALNPVGGEVASAIVTVDPLEYIPLEPVVEDLHTKGKKKRVILVFDDLSRSRLDLNNVVGTINEYCENMGFTTIVIAEEEFFKSVLKVDPMVYKMIKEKTIARTVRYIPDYRTIIHNIITKSDWQSEEYAEFLEESEQVICDVFVSKASDIKNDTRKFHNFRSLICALQEFYRFYERLKKDEVSNIHQYLYSFITYIIISRNGIFKNGKLCFDSEEEDIKQLYPGYKPELLTEEIRDLIEYGIWEDDADCDQTEIDEQEETETD